MKRGKKGQITLFIIIGIIILGLAVLYFFFSGYFSSIRLDAAKPVAEKIPFELEPVKKFTTDCVKATAEEGLAILGQQGGYIKPEEWHSLQFNEEDQTNADGLGMGQVKVPYWLYNKAENDNKRIQLISRKPDLTDTEDELERWISEELETCLERYKLFEGYTIREGETKATVNFASGVVKIAVSHPLDVEKQEITGSMENFYTELEVDVPKMYSIASRIYTAQENSSFLEANTVNLIGIFSGTDVSKLPPMTDSTFKLANTVFWTEMKVKEDLKQILTGYVPLLRYYGSRNYYRYEFPLSEYSGTKQRVYDDMILPLDGADGVEVRFDYLGWEPYLDVNAKGGIIQPQSFSLSYNMLNFGVQRFKTVYDISYPVWITLHDPNALEGRGFSFNFAMEANIRNNRAVEAGQVLPEPIGLERESQLCDLGQRLSGNITVVVKDAYSKDALENVQVTYVLGDESCIIGLTDETGILKAAFPVAIGGVVHAAALDYLGTSRYLDAEMEKDERIEIELMPYKEIKVALQKKKVVKCDGVCYSGDGPLIFSGGKGWLFNDAGVGLKDTEQGVISFKRISDLDDSVNFAVLVNGREASKARLPAGDYNITVQLILNEEVVIPEEERCEEIEVLGVEVDKECYVIPESRFEQFPNGGFEGGIEIKAGDYYPAEEIMLTAVSPAITDIPVQLRKIEDIEMISKLGDFVSANMEKIGPVYR